LDFGGCGQLGNGQRRLHTYRLDRLQWIMWLALRDMDYTGQRRQAVEAEAMA